MQEEDDPYGNNLDRSMTSVGIFGDDLDPKEVSALLGCKPSTGGRKGEPIRSRSRRRAEAPRRLTGAWILRAEERRPADFDGQIRELLGRVTSDLAVWAGLAARFEIRAFLGVFMVSGNDELVFSAEILALLAERGIRLHLDIYGPVPDDDDPDDEDAPRLH